MVTAVVFVASSKMVGVMAALVEFEMESVLMLVEALHVSLKVCCYVVRLCLSLKI